MTSAEYIKRNSHLDLYDLLERRRADAKSPDERSALDKVYDDLALSAMHGGPFEPRASMQTWRETLAMSVADTAITNSAVETILTPDQSIPANYLIPGRCLKWTLFGNSSFVITTPGTLTMRLRYGGVAGTVLAASGAYAPDPTAAQANRSWGLEWYVVARANGTAAAHICFGKFWLNDVDDATVTTLQGNLNMSIAPASAPATVNINTTTANALSPTVTHSVATAGTQTTCQMAILESLS
jgi:hypothetical protein